MLIIFNMKGLLLGIAALIVGAAAGTVIGQLDPAWGMLAGILVGGGTAIALDVGDRKSGNGGGALFFIPVFAWGIVVCLIGLMLLVPLVLAADLFRPV